MERRAQRGGGAHVTSGHLTSARRHGGCRPGHLARGVCRGESLLVLSSRLFDSRSGAAHPPGGGSEAQGRTRLVAWSPVRRAASWAASALWRGCSSRCWSGRSPRASLGRPDVVVVLPSHAPRLVSASFLPCAASRSSFASSCCVAASALESASSLGSAGSFHRRVGFRRQAPAAGVGAAAGVSLSVALLADR